MCAAHAAPLTTMDTVVVYAAITRTLCTSWFGICAWGVLHVSPLSVLWREFGEVSSILCVRRS